MIPERITKFFGKDGIMELNMNFCSYIFLHL